MINPRQGLGITAQHNAVVKDRDREEQKTSQCPRTRYVAQHRHYVQSQSLHDPKTLTNREGKHKWACV